MRPQSRDAVCNFFHPSQIILSNLTIGLDLYKEPHRSFNLPSFNGGLKRCSEQARGVVELERPPDKREQRFRPPRLPQPLRGNYQIFTVSSHESICHGIYHGSPVDFAEQAAIYCIANTLIRVEKRAQIRAYIYSQHLLPPMTCFRKGSDARAATILRLA